MTTGWDHDGCDHSPDSSCGYRGHLATASSTMAQGRALQEEEGEEEEEEEDGGHIEASRGQRQRQRPRVAPQAESGQREATASRRHRPLRKRSRGNRTESVASPGYSEPVASYWELGAIYWEPVAVALAQVSQLGTEAAGWLLHSCCRLGSLGWAPCSLQGWGHLLGQQFHSGSSLLARWLRRSAGLLTQLLGILLAFLFLLFMLLLGTLRLCWRWGAAGTAWVATSCWPRRLLDTGGLHRTWALLVETLRDWGLPWWGDQMASPVLGEAPNAGEEEVARLVALAEVAEEDLDPFQVLGLEVSATDAELRRAYRRLAVLVHPDKSQHPRAAAAFRVLRTAWDAVSSPERRRDCERKRLARTELRRSVGELLSRLQEELRDAINTMSCSKCHGQHRRFELQRDPLSARYCAQCGGLHPADEGDLWAESRLLGLRVSYLARMGGRIYDITEWAGCQKVAIAPDTHRVPYHLSFGARGPAPAGRHRSSSSSRPPSAADLQDFLTRVFQGGGGTVGGPFSSPPTSQGAAAPTGGPSRPEGTAAKAGDPKHKRRRKIRRPLQR